MSFPMLASKDMSFSQSFFPAPVNTNQPVVVQQHVEPVVVPVSPSITTSVEPSHVSSIIANISTVPKSLLWVVGLSGAIGLMSYISMKYCPWWKNRMWKKLPKNNTPSEASSEVPSEERK